MLRSQVIGQATATRTTALTRLNCPTKTDQARPKYFAQRVSRETFDKWTLINLSTPKHIRKYIRRAVEGA